ncbi:MAG: OmpA family protein [Bacteroidales bacterium]|nr:OmpA family protein [Bacteroidales bacterium]
MKVKKFILSCLAAVAVFGLSAQEAEKTEKTENVFVPHWYVQGQFGAQYTLGEVSFGKLMAPNAQLSFGRQFGEVLGARFGINAWQSKAGQADYRWAWNYIAPSLDATFNLSNAVCGYNPDRLFSLSAIAGLGVNVTFGNAQANNFNNDLKSFLSSTNNFPGDALEYLWNGTKAFMNAHVGLAGDFRITDNLSAGIEVQAVALSDKYNSKKAGNADWYFNALAGVKYCFGKTHEHRVVESPRPVEEIIDEYVEKKMKPMAEEMDAMKKDLEETKAAQEEQNKKFESMEEEISKSDPVYVLFRIGSSNISDAAKVKIKEVADYMKQNPASKVWVVGYADFHTGTAEYNYELAQKRADSVVAELKKAGIEESRIKSDRMKENEQPFADHEMNRVVICTFQK